MAFVFLNRYLDLSEVCDDDSVEIGHALHCYFVTFLLVLFFIISDEAHFK